MHRNRLLLLSFTTAAVFALCFWTFSRPSSNEPSAPVGVAMGPTETAPPPVGSNLAGVLQEQREFTAPRRTGNRLVQPTVPETLLTDAESCAAPVEYLLLDAPSEANGQFTVRCRSQEWAIWDPTKESQSAERPSPIQWYLARVPGSAAFVVDQAGLRRMAHEVIQDAVTCLAVEPRMGDKLKSRHKIFCQPVESMAEKRGHYLLGPAPLTSGTRVHLPSQGYVIADNVQLRDLHSNTEYAFYIGSSDSSIIGGQVESSELRMRTPGNGVLAWTRSPGVTFIVSSPIARDGMIYCRRVDNARVGFSPLGTLRDGQCWVAAFVFDDGEYEFFGTGPNWRSGYEPTVHAFHSGASENVAITLPCAIMDAAEVRLRVNGEHSPAYVLGISKTGALVPLGLYPTESQTVTTFQSESATYVLGLEEAQEVFVQAGDGAAMTTAVVEPGLLLELSLQAPEKRLFTEALDAIRLHAADYAGALHPVLIELQQQHTVARGSPVWASVLVDDMHSLDESKWLIPVDPGRLYQLLVRVSGQVDLVLPVPTDTSAAPR